MDGASSSEIGINVEVTKKCILLFDQQGWPKTLDYDYKGLGYENEKKALSSHRTLMSIVSNLV